MMKLTCGFISAKLKKKVGSVGDFLLNMKC